MAYDHYFETGIAESGSKFTARFDGEHLGIYTTPQEARAAVKNAKRRAQRRARIQES